MPRLQNPERFKKATEEEMLKVAEEVITKELEDSTVLNRDELDNAPRFHIEELQVGRVVGRGGFCVVKEINSIKLHKTEDMLNRSSTSVRSEDQRAMASREHLARLVYARKGDSYVVKLVEPQLYQDDKVTFLKGIIDLSVEALYLSSLKHPHILRLRGLSLYDPHHAIQSFLIVDRLTATLSKKLNTWMHQTRATKGITGFVTGGKRKQTGIHVEKLLCAHDISDALNYLHSKKIVYRDLKPDNVGFSKSGILKLFDFGLSRELHEKDLNPKDGLYYHMTGFTGSIRYMAPEVGLSRPYNHKVDVYSWSMLLWYMLALEPPFGLYSPRMHVDRVFRKKYRPGTQEKWGPTLQKLLRDSWSDNISDRPEFVDIMRILKAEVEKYDGHIASFMKESSSESKLDNSFKATE